jgi:hypothetical protein
MGEKKGFFYIIHPITSSIIKFFALDGCERPTHVAIAWFQNPN